MNLRTFYICLFCFLIYFAFPQKSKKILDFKKKLQTEKQDTNKVVYMFNLSRLLFKSNYEEALSYYNDGMKLANKLKRVDLMIDGLNAMADGFWFTAEYDQSFNYYYRAYQIADSIGNKKQISLSLYNLGWLSCIEQRNYKDIDYLYRSLQIANETGEVFGKLRTYNALGECYSSKYKTFQIKSDFDSAVYYLKKGLDYGRSQKDFEHLSTYYINLGDLFYFIKDYKTAKFYQLNGLDNYRFKGDSVDLYYVYFKIAQCDFELGKRDEALNVYKKSYELFKAKGYKEAELETLINLATANYRANNFKAAYDYYDVYTKMKDEVDKNSYSTNLQSIENSHSLEKSRANVIQLQQANEIEELRNKKKTIYISLLIVVGLVIVVIAFLLFRQGKLRHATNLKLQEQNKIISEKKLEIEQSIDYAKGIQTAFLPAKEELGYLVKENFIFYKPKDVVSGDFYWFLPTSGKNTFLLACADCTGHGVPGALMSMIGINTLQQLSVERKLESPGLILKILNVEIKNSLKQNTDQNKQRDGMDIALIHVDLAAKKIKYAAANRPLYIIREGDAIEYKATKHAIGGYTAYDQTFEETTIDLQSGDLVCLTTDGYADQFGGPDAKKFMTKNLKALLIKIYPLSTTEQSTQLEAVFNNWKGKHAQVDDVCVIGLKV